MNRQIFAVLAILITLSTAAAVAVESSDDAEATDWTHQVIYPTISVTEDSYFQSDVYFALWSSKCTWQYTFLGIVGDCPDGVAIKTVTDSWEHYTIGGIIADAGTYVIHTEAVSNASTGVIYEAYYTVVVGSSGNGSGSSGVMLQLILDGNGGDSSYMQQLMTAMNLKGTLGDLYGYEHDFTLDFMPIRAGYDFVGWSTSATASAAEFTTSYDMKVAAEDLSDAASSTNAVTLYAVWSQIGLPDANTICFTVYFAARGGSIVAAKSSYAPTGTESVTFSLDRTSVRDGYSLKGWALDAESSTVSDSVTVPHTGTYSSVTVYALWEKNDGGGNALFQVLSILVIAGGVAAIVIRVKETW